MDLRTIVNKINDGTKLLLTIPTILFRNRETVALIESAHTVSPYEEGRPDLIAAKYYGDVSGLDIILKYNNISNPFSIKSGEILKILFYFNYSLTRDLTHSPPHTKLFSRSNENKLSLISTERPKPTPTLTLTRPKYNTRSP